ncbi:MAG: YhjD/YihY/BrkB family envelope integrity protein [bacterium]
MIVEPVRRLRRFLAEDLWNRDFDPGTPGGRVVGLLQFGAIVGRGFVRDHLLLRASALTYFTALSLIPLLAVAISLVQAVGVGGETFATFLVHQVAAGSPDAQRQILDLAESANFRGLGTVGASILFLTTVLAVTNIETSLNRIWGVTRQRSLVRRLSDYLAVLVIAPLLLAVAGSLAGSLQSQYVFQRMMTQPWFARLHEFGLRHVPLALLALAFTFLNWILPNTTVRLRSAFLGGALAASLVVVAQTFYLDFAIGVARANALFGGFAALPLLFVWIYLFWAIFLLGAEFAFAHQNLALYRREVRGPRAGPAEREAVGLRIALEIARAFRRGGDPWNADTLSDALAVPVRTVRDILETLHAAGILSPQGAPDREGAWQLGRPAGAIAVLDVAAALRGRRERVDGQCEVADAAERLVAELAAGEAAAAAGRTLEDVLETLDGPLRPGTGEIARGGKEKE